MVDAAARLVSSSILVEPAEFNLACVGTSIFGLTALSLDSIRYLAHADIVYCYPVTSAHLQFLREINPNIVDLNATLYRDGGSYADTYAAIVQEISGTIAHKKKVAYAQQGSPVFLAHTSIELARWARAKGYKVAIVPGVSSFECLLANLTLNHDLYDIQLYNCGSVVTGASNIDARVPCVLFNLASFANHSISQSKNRLAEDPSNNSETRSA